MEKKERER